MRCLPLTTASSEFADYALPALIQAQLAPIDNYLGYLGHLYC